MSEKMQEIEIDDSSQKAMSASWELLSLLRELKQRDSDRGRLWAISATDAEKLHAWVCYVVATMDDN